MTKKVVEDFPKKLTTALKRRKFRTKNGKVRKMRKISTIFMVSKSNNLNCG